jgi:hypothetical protein
MREEELSSATVFKTGRCQGRTSKPYGMALSLQGSWATGQ